LPSAFCGSPLSVARWDAAELRFCCQTGAFTANRSSQLAKLCASPVDVGAPRAPGPSCRLCRTRRGGCQRGSLRPAPQSHRHGHSTKVVTAAWSGHKEQDTADSRLHPTCPYGPASASENSREILELQSRLPEQFLLLPVSQRLVDTAQQDDPP